MLLTDFTVCIFTEPAYPSAYPSAYEPPGSVSPARLLSGISDNQTYQVSLPEVVNMDSLSKECSEWNMSEPLQLLVRKT